MYKADLTIADAMEALSCREKSSSDNNEFDVVGAVEPWPPVWKSIEKCQQHYFLTPFLEPMREKSTDPKVLLLYKQVEETRGYDVTVKIRNPFIPNSKAYIDLYELWCQDAVKHINMQAEIHGELYEYFEFVKCVSVHKRDHLMTFKVKKVKSGGVKIAGCHLKTVQAFMIAQSVYLLEVEEWRFKPDD